MTRAEYKDKQRIVDILAASFQDNESVNYIAKQDKKRAKRIRNLMTYSFEVCYLFGEVVLTENRNACALILYPDKKKTTLRSIFLDIQLIFSCIGIENLKKALTRETRIKQLQPTGLLCYLWFIGVKPECQNRGIGSDLLNNIIAENEKKKRPIYLETSTRRNLPWYNKFGFKIYNELDLGYKLFFLKRD